MAESEKGLVKTFRCKHCGSEKRIIQDIKNEEVKKGKVGADIPMGSQQRLVVVFDPSKSAIICPVVVLIFDVCAECGSEQVREVRYTTGQPQAMLTQHFGQHGQGSKFGTQAGPGDLPFLKG